ncbi:transcription factor SPT20 homolog [Trifolium pratense]|uniref:transcription factor SPT20 homolog n=1 Tax=Trifolium pratense TaxID=57577 RepID=UPI001E6974B6|nr:transcription factor SPT20 homolog [Trifolium pratense]
MTDRGYYNFYTPGEYESYQQFPPYNYGQTSEARLEETMIKFMEMQQQQNQQWQQQLQQMNEQMQQMQDQHQQYLKNSLARAKNLENQLVQLTKQLANNNYQGGTFQTNTQTTPDEKDNNPMKNEESGESVKDVENNEEERMCDGCGVEKIVEEIETPKEVELPQESPCIQNTSTVDNEEVMMAAEEIEGLLDKEISIEQKREMENQTLIDRVIDEICALFNKKELGRIWTPQHLYLKFMEFLPNRRKKTDDVLSVSFWPP